MSYKPKVLVVDDEDLTLEFLRLLLSPKYEVYTCANVKDFYTLIGEIKFDIILMDVFLRDSKDGIELTRELKMNHSCKDIPVIVLTAQISTRDRQHAINAGAQLVLNKPVDTKFLFKCIEESISVQLQIQ